MVLTLDEIVFKYAEVYCRNRQDRLGLQVYDFFAGCSANCLWQPGNDALCPRHLCFNTEYNYFHGELFLGVYLILGFGGVRNTKDLVTYRTVPKSPRRLRSNHV